MPHTYINNGKILYFCSEQETKGCARSENIFKTYDFEFYPEQITNWLVRKGVTHYNKTLVFPLRKKNPTEIKFHLCEIRNDTFDIIESNVPRKHYASLMTIVSNKTEDME